MYKQPLEQAVFTRSESADFSGYRLVAASFGVGEADARELAAWGPAHDSMLDFVVEATSLNFHPLPSGAFCVSRSLSLDGGRVFTHCMIVPPETLAKFGNNPFAINRAATINGLWLDDDPSEVELDPLWLPGGAAPVDEALLGRLTSDFGPARVATMVQMARESVVLAVGGAVPPDILIAGVFACLPPECRTEFPFSTGLKFSPRRQFRIVAVSDDPAERSWMAGYPNVSIFDPRCDESFHSTPLDGWGQLIKRSLANDKISFLTAQMARRRFNLALDDLPALGMQLQEELESLEMGRRRPVEQPASAVHPAARSAHAAHQQFAKRDGAGATATSPGRTPSLGHSPPEVLDKLERLDDIVYEAMNGQPDALQQLQTSWPKLISELDDELAAESREQYLRYALSIWRECADSGGTRQSSRAIQALDVLCLLFDDTVAKNY